MPKRNLVALFSNDLVGSYQYALWAGMKAAAREEDCDLVSFNGGEVGSRDPLKSMRTSAFDLARHARPDAIVLTAPVLANAATERERDAFLASLAPVPIVTVGFEIPGHPAVMVDNSKGMDDAVEHLVAAHGRRHLVFMGGPLCNPDAIVRREAFLRVLERHGIPFEPANDLVGEFDFGIARNRLRALMDTGAEFNGVVAANDEMALGVMEALKERGRKIPDDVVVVGFDDIEDGQFSSPALATVRQPVFQQGEAALRMALDLVEGVEPESAKPHPALLVRRGSCGCHSHALEDALRGRVQASPGAPAGPEHLAECRKACRGMPGCSRMTEVLEDLAGAMARDVDGDASSNTLERFHFLLETHSHPEDPQERWQVFLSKYRSASLPFFSATPTMLERFEGMIHQMRVIVHERTAQMASYKAVQTQRWTRYLNETGCQLVNSFDEKDLVETLAQAMKGLHISSLHLVLREPGVGASSGRLVLSVDAGTRKELPPGGVVRDYREILDSFTRRSHFRSALVVEPLFFGARQLGYVMLELALRRGILLDILRAQISAALMGASIVRETSTCPTSTCPV